MATALRQQSSQRLLGLISALGAKPLAVKLYIGLRDFLFSFRTRFRVRLDDVEVIFVTEDAHSRRFFHHRYAPGEPHEPPVSQELASRVRDAKVFADVGAHIGYYACLAGAVNHDLQLLVFEMNHNLIGIIERNLEANAISRYELINHAVSDRRKSICYAGDSTDAGMAMHAPDDREAGDVAAETVALDEVFAERELLPDVIKIDVQGAEMEVLRGAERILRERHPTLLLEVHPKVIGDFGASAREVYDCLLAHGYRLHMVDEHRRTAGRLIDLDPAAPPPAHTHMLLCL